MLLDGQMAPPVQDVGTESHGTCLVIVFKNCYLKRYENCCLKSCKNCGLKSVVERIFSVNKTKKCVWYHSLNNIFQCSKNVKYVFGMCVFNDKKS